MKTYVLEINDVPLVAFRATDDEAAARWPSEVFGKLSPLKLEGLATTVRLATIPEQAEWRKDSVKSGEADEQDGRDDTDFDALVVPLRAGPLSTFGKSRIG